MKYIILDVLKKISSWVDRIKSSQSLESINKAAPVIDSSPISPAATYNVMNTDFINDINQCPMDKDEYLQSEYPKTQIYLHHTAGNPNGRRTISNWNNDKRGRIATCVTISNINDTGSYDGEICQAFSSKYWAYHLGIKQEHFDRFDLPYKNLNKVSIGIEICAWGYLTKRGDKFYNYIEREVPADQVCELEKPYKGHKYYHKYTDAQIESVKNLLLYWNEVYGIPLDYDEKIWDVCEDAYKNVPGVYTHNSVRPDKSDVFPQPELIAMLKSLTA